MNNRWWAGLSLVAGAAALSCCRIFSRDRRRAVREHDAVCVYGLTKTEAEDLLDWLEANGYLYREVLISGKTFTVRYR